MLIAVPSKGRAGKVTSIDILGNAKHLAVVFCPQSEADAYREHHGEVVGVPDSVKGITATRNHILDYAKDRGIKRIVQVDDDAYMWVYFQNRQRVDLPDHKKLGLLTNFFDMAEAMGTNLFGFQVSSDPKFYREYSPFSLTSVVVGNLMGIIDDGQRFDERLKLKEDYDFSLQTLYRHRRILRGNRYSWRVEHHDTDGGCKSYRSMSAELEAIEILQAKWGDKIVQRHKKKPYEITVRCPIPGI